MLEQFRFFFQDYRKICGQRKVRYLYVWMNRVTVGIFLYRFERGMFLFFGKGWKFLRILILPLLQIIYAYANSEIHYQAVIGPGLLILHASTGVVISARAKIGNNLTLVGGNIIGIREEKKGDLVIGNNCYLGANAVILGPVTLGDNTTIGACALVIHDYPGNGTVIGSPAVPTKSI